jgi:hypothetical protein
VKRGNINTTPEDVNTRTMREVIEVMKKNARVDSNNTPATLSSRERGWGGGIVERKRGC